MLRDPNLVPLSRQHQHALGLCVRIDRGIGAEVVDLEAWQSEIQQLFKQEIAVHFEAEEQDIFPAANRIPELKNLVQELKAEHVTLRELFTRAANRTLDEEGLRSLGEKLADHIRKEERQLFEQMQTLMSPEELHRLGPALLRTLSNASPACILPSAATRLRPEQ